MSKTVYVDTKLPATADALYCDECDGATVTESGFHEGQAAIERHQDQHPDHQQVVWLRREVV